MKSRIAFFASAVLSITYAHAADLTWNNGTATGNWNTTDANWTGSTWNNATPDNAIFDAAGIGTVTLTEPITTGNVTFNNAGYTIAANTITLGPSGINADTLTSGTNTISSDLSLAAGSQTWSTGAGSTLAVNGTLTRAAGAVLTLSSTGTYTSSSITNVNDIVGPWAFVGTGSSARYATVSGGSLVAYTGGTASAAFSWSSSADNTVNYDVAGGSDIGFNRTANTVRYVGITGKLGLGASNGNTLFTINGLMNVGTGTLTISMVSGTGNPAVVIGSNNNNELVLNAAARDITINVPVNNTGATTGTANGATASSVAITGGDGLAVTFGGTNLYTGTTTVGGGALRLSSASALPGGIGATGGTANLLLNGGYVEMAFDNFARALGTGAAEVQITGGTSGFSANGAARTVNLGGASAAITWGSASYNPATLVLNGTTANNTLDFQNPIDLGASPRTVLSGANTATLSGILSGTGASLVKAGNGTLTLTALNTFTGGTTVNAGNLLLNYASASDAAVRGTVTVNTGATLTVSGPNFGGFGTNAGSKIDTLNVVGGSVVVSGDKTNKDATFNLTGGTISGGKINWRNSALNSLASATASTISSSIMIRNDFAAGVPLTFNVADGGAADDLVIGGVISQPGTTGASVVKSGAGTLKLTKTNTYTGSTTISAGTLVMGNSNVIPDVSAVSIDTATLDANTFADTCATLDVTGTANINLGSGAALAFADSSEVDWTGGTLNVTGTLEATSLRFGATSGGLDPAQLALISVNGSGLGTCTLDANGYLVTANPFSTWAQSRITDIDSLADATPTGDPDADGVNNLTEFAFNGDPLDGADNGYRLGQTANVPSVGNSLILTFATRAGADFGTGATATADGVNYTAQGSLDLDAFASPVTKVTPAIVPPGWPAGGDYEYHTFRLDASTGLAGKGFLRVKTEQ